MKLSGLLAASLALALLACSKPAAEKPAEPAAAPAQPPLVTVNGKAISTQLYEDYVKAVAGGKPSSELSQEDRDQIKENLVRIELIAQQAEKDGLTRDPEVASRLELTRLNLLQQASAQRYLKDKTPSEQELRAEFETQLASSPLVEYHARHILVSSEDVAQKVIEQLKGGADFAALAKRISSDKTSAVKGGELDWFAPNTMMTPFADAVALLKKGEYTRTPVQTQFGWHVIQLLGTRDRTPPTYESSKQQLSQIVMARKFRAYSDELLKAAKIDPPLANLPAEAPPADSAPAPAEAPKAD